MEKVRANIIHQPVFISGKFHKSLRAESRHNCSCVAIWDSEKVYWQAYDKSVGSMKTAPQHIGVGMTPALLDVLFEY